MPTYIAWQKHAYDKCDRNSKRFLGVLSCNRVYLREVVLLFEDYCRANGRSVNAALRELRSDGIIISKQGLNKAKRGQFSSMGITWCCSLLTYCGYSLSFKPLDVDFMSEAV